MNRSMIAALVASLTLAACSGGGSDGPSGPMTDYSGNFVGTWVGSSSMTMNGESSSSSNVYARIAPVDTNTITVLDVCVDGSGPNAEITSASAFRMAGITCAPFPVTGCSGVTLAYAAGGTGKLSNGQLALNVTGNASGCGLSFPFTMTFNGARVSTTPIVPTMMAADEASPLDTIVLDGGTLSSAVAAEVAPLF